MANARERIERYPPVIGATLPRLRSPAQRSEQVVIVSQTRSHFLRHANGREQTIHIRVGKSPLRRILLMTTTQPDQNRWNEA